MDDLAPSDNGSSPATFTSGASTSATVASSRTSSGSSVPRQKMTKYHSFTHVFPATSERPSERTPSSTRDSALSRDAMRELLNPTPSTDRDERTRMLFNGLQWLLESSTTGRELDQSSSQPLKALSHDAVNAFNSDVRVHTTTLRQSGRSTGSGPQSTEAWIHDQSKVNQEKPW